MTAGIVLRNISRKRGDRVIALRILESIGLYKPVDYNHRRFDGLGKRITSPIEHIFWSAGYFELSKCGILTPQHKIGPYRVDFAYQGEGLKVVIELDGHDYHSAPAQMTADYKRQRALQSLGWLVIRFTGSEIYGDVQGCVREIMRVVRGHNG